MIIISDKKDCCGCEACIQICPKKCISFSADDEGFGYPLINISACIDCGLCNRVCPITNQDNPRKPLKTYAAKNPDEIVRFASSSGGIFTMLADTIIDAGGVVFGAQFDKNWDVEHRFTETKDGIEAFRGSKYVQSRIGQSYLHAQDFLKKGRTVLFSGTSCQIAGLRKFLRKDYENLFTMDVVCHGVPSPLVWRRYLEEILKCPKGTDGKNTVLSSLNENPVLTEISFREKSLGWKKFGFIIRGKSAIKADKNSVSSSANSEQDIVLIREMFRDNLYTRGFLANMYLRPSCHSCPARCGKSRSDISLGDWWGISNYYPDFDDDKGVSLVLVNSIKGEKLIKSLSLDLIETEYESALNGNMCLEHSVVMPAKRAKFWRQFHHRGIQAIRQVIVRQNLTTYKTSIVNKLKRLFK